MEQMSSNVSLLVGGSGGACSRFAPIYPSRRPADATVEVKLKAC